MRIAGQASFLTGDGHTIHAWVHGPRDEKVRGAVIVAPALAREEVVSHRSMRLVAARAAQAGWLVLRLAWSGTSESGERPAGSDPVAPVVAAAVAVALELWPAAAVEPAGPSFAEAAAASG